MIPEIVMDQDLKEIFRLVSLDEVKNDIFSFGAFKDPDPNVFRPNFFKVFGSWFQVIFSLDLEDS